MDGRKLETEIHRPCSAFTQHLYQELNQIFNIVKEKPSLLRHFSAQCNIVAMAMQWKAAIASLKMLFLPSMCATLLKSTQYFMRQDS